MTGVFVKFKKFYNRITFLWVLLAISVIIGYTLSLISVAASLEGIHDRHPEILNHRYLNVHNIELSLIPLYVAGLIFIILGANGLMSYKIPIKMEPENDH